MSRKKLLLYANYFYPEVAALGQLYTDLCSGLKDEFDITVICSIPCYTGSIDAKYIAKSYYFEEYGGVKVIRVKVPEVNKLSKKSRLLHILAYFFRSIAATFRTPRVDYVMAGSQPPILGGLLGVAGKWINLLRGKRAKLLYNIQDYNPEQTMVIGYSRQRILLKMMMILDKFSCMMADKVIVVGRDMLDTMQKRFTLRSGKISQRMPKTVFINNWMDERAVYPLEASDPGVAAFREKYGLTGKRVIMYSGNIGLYYDLNQLMKVIERFKEDERIVFPFVGDGAKKGEIQAYAEAHNLKNVVFIPYQAKEELIFSLNAADIHWVINAKGIKGISCPSKLYGVLAVAKPVLAVLEEGTEARNVVEKTRCGMAASPGEYDEIARIIEWAAALSDEELIAAGRRGYDCMSQNYTCEIALRKYRNEIRSC